MKGMKLGSCNRSLHVLTVDPSCGRCKGKGVYEWRELAPGEIPVYGGHNAKVTRRQVCSCVQSELVTVE